MIVQVSCNICGHDAWRVRFAATDNNPARLEVDACRCTCDGYGHHQQIVECNHCGHVYANPRWASDDLLDAYEAVEDETYILERAGRERTFAHHLQSLEKFTGPGDGRPLLDVGAYIGVFVAVARSRDWQALGIEPSLWASTFAKERDLPVVQGTLDAQELDGRRFDVITMWDVVEHLDDPMAEVAKARRLLNPGGIVAVHTMDVNSLMARLMGSRWPWLMDMHVQYFSRESLRRLLLQNDLEVIWIGVEGRYLSLGYLASRVAALSRPLGRLVSGVVEGLGLSDTTVPVNFGDLFTIYARRPADDD
ncbi:MAG: class I SAM-dependent methyltransferase [Chloroflexota bacterium]|nr:MAG: class I SAM-dependent methyltransferase [Chloroflexota bacterium]